MKIKFLTYFVCLFFVNNIFAQTTEKLNYFGIGGTCIYADKGLYSGSTAISDISLQNVKLLLILQPSDENVGYGVSAGYKLISLGNFHFSPIMGFYSQIQGYQSKTAVTTGGLVINYKKIIPKSTYKIKRLKQHEKLGEIEQTSDSFYRFNFGIVVTNYFAGVTIGITN
jgi:hypothetical protein